IVEPAALPRWVRKRDYHRPGTEAPSDAVLQPSGAEKTLDGHLSNRDQHLRHEDSQLSFEPVGAVGDCRRWRAQVAGIARVAPGEATHERGDVGESPKLLGALETGLHNPAVELLAGATRKWASRLTLRPPGRLTHEQESSAPPTLKRRIGLGNDPRVDASVALAASKLMLFENRATHPAHEN